jgi:hypothetical protein
VCKNVQSLRSRKKNNNLKIGKKEKRNKSGCQKIQGHFVPGEGCAKQYQQLLQICVRSVEQAFLQMRVQFQSNFIVV